jgi:NADPH-dependent 2,4-dienoyl-CoA reductase/sulfur reductase-like enzyme/nitrite reductase/ring-hydroxylating ferredoxin subunit
MVQRDTPDFGNGIAIDELPEGTMIQGKLRDEEIILARQGDEVFAVGAKCSHYGGPLAQGLLIAGELRCPWHHACFSLRTGEALRAPALDPIACWSVERVGTRLFVRERLPPPSRRRMQTAGNARQIPSSVVIIGGGAAGLSAAHTLRQEGYDGPVTIISADTSAPYDRPNLSKDYLAGTASDEWMPLRSPDYYRDQRIDLILESRATAVDLRRRRIEVDTGRSYEFDRLLLATGADPVHLSIPGAQQSGVHYLRTYADGRALARKAASAKQAIVIGGSFIGLEVAASLRARGLEVHVVALEKQPLERVLGPEIGRFIRSLHEAHGVVFHMEDSVSRVEGQKFSLKKGATVDADLLVLGVGVRPSIALAEQAGLRVDRGIVVNKYLETSEPGIFAAGDVATWPDARTGELIRVEHWVVAERQGQIAARNMLGFNEEFDAVPFFWTQHFDVSINYVGHAEKWDNIQTSGSLEARDCALTYNQGGRVLAVATVSRDLQSLQSEAGMESELDL